MRRTSGTPKSHSGKSGSTRVIAAPFRQLRSRSPIETQSSQSCDAGSDAPTACRFSSLVFDGHGSATVARKNVANIGDHHLFSIMRTGPNAVVWAFHEKTMPVMLMTPEDVERWLAGKSASDAIDMQKPASDAAIRIVDIESAA